MPTCEPILRAGIDFTNRGELKFARAVHLANELRGRVDEWSAAETLLAKIQQSDEHTVQFLAVVEREPPIEEWSLVLGDALHNLRSAFDNVMWALATLDGAEPMRPNQVTFPVTKSNSEWTARMRSLESVPPVYLERVRALQAWAEGIEPEQSMLWLLSQVDNIDKHRGLIAGAVHFKQMGLVGFDLRMQPVATANEAEPVMEFQQQPIRLSNDTVVLTIRSTTHTLHPDPAYIAKLHVQFFLEWGDGRIMMLDGFLQEVLARTREWLDRIYGGDLYAKSLALARQYTGPTTTFGFVDENGKRKYTHLVHPSSSEAPVS